MKVLTKYVYWDICPKQNKQYPEISHILDNSPWQSEEADGHISFIYSHPDVTKIAVGTSPSQK